MAAGISSPKIFSLLVQRGAKINDTNVLHTAIGRNDEETVAMLTHLLNLGADIDHILHSENLVFFRRKIDFGLGTPLHYAVKRNKVELVRFLLGNGANRYLKSAKGTNAFEWARRMGRQDCLQALENPLSGERSWRASPFRNLSESKGTG